MDDHKTIMLSCANTKSMDYLHYTCVNLQHIFKSFGSSREKPPGAWSGLVSSLPAAVSGAGLNFEQSLCTGYCGGEQVTPGRRARERRVSSVTAGPQWGAVVALCSALGAMTRPQPAASPCQVHRLVNVVFRATYFQIFFTCQLNTFTNRLFKYFSRYQIFSDISYTMTL